MSASKGPRLTVSVKLSSVVGISLVALCVMGVIAVFSAREIQRLGQDLYTENKQLLDMEMNVSVNIERAIADVQSAPSELNLDALKSKQAHLHTLLDDAKKVLNQTLTGNAAADVKAGSTAIVAAMENSKTRRRRCSTSPLRLLSLKPSPRFHQQWHRRKQPFAWRSSSSAKRLTAPTSQRRQSSSQQPRR